MNSIYKNIRFFQFLLFCACILSSCITSSNIKYLQKNKENTQTKYKIQQVDYHVQIGDNLYIKLSSIEPIADEALSQESGGVVTTGLSSTYKDVYLVDNEGYVKLPQLDKIKVEGLALNQIKDSVDIKIAKFYGQTTSQVRLASNYVTIIGNVNSPGRYLVDFNDKITIFELIGMAGDLSFEANRSDVKIIRKKGLETEIVNLDLTKRDVLESDYYYVLPNDVVYVDPLKAVSWNQRFFPFATTLTLLLTTTTTLIVLISYF